MRRGGRGGDARLRRSRRRGCLIVAVVAGVATWCTVLLRISLQELPSRRSCKRDFRLLNGTDLPGPAFAELPIHSPVECCQACARSSRCAAWTLGAQCSLKEASTFTPVLSPSTRYSGLLHRLPFVKPAVVKPIVVPKKPPAAATKETPQKHYECCSSDEEELRLWADSPAADWSECWPIGNGRMGALMGGEVWHQRVAIAEETLYETKESVTAGHKQAQARGAANRAARQKARKATPDDEEWFAKPKTPLEAFKKARAALLRGDVDEATRASRWLDGGPVASFLGLASLRVLVNGGPLNYFEEEEDKSAKKKPKKKKKTVAAVFEDAARKEEDWAVTNYTRHLDIPTGVVRERFVAHQRRSSTEERHQRTHFASYPAGVVVMKYECEPSCVRLEVAVETRNSGAAARVADGKLVLATPRFAACARLVATEDGGATGGEVLSSGASRDSVVVLVGAATDFRGPDFVARCEAQLDATAKKGYAALLAEHLADFASNYGETRLELVGGCSRSHLPTATRIVWMRGVPRKQNTSEAQQTFCEEDVWVYSVAFAYARYLLLSSSRKGGQPANLQGVWADGLKAPWGGDYHLNINLQMTYWPAFAANLAPTAEPLTRFVAKLQQTGAVTAREWYNASGWVAHGYTDIWQDARALGENKWSLCVTCGAWAALALYEAFEFGGERGDLAASLNALEGSVRFFRDYLVEVDSCLLTGPTTSPENSYRNGTKWAYLTMSPAMDVAVLRRVFEAYLAASSALAPGDAELVRWAREAKLPNAGLPVVKDGLVREYPLLPSGAEAADWGHRHFSGLWHWMPGRGSPEKAALQTLDKKVAAGGGHTGWSRAWAACLYARLLEPEKVEVSLKRMMTLYLCPTNLLATHPPLRPSNARGCATCFEPQTVKKQVLKTRGMVTGEGGVFQMDGNMGLLAAMTESLLQSHQGPLSRPVVHLLPALPPSWRLGAVYHLRARGGIDVSVHWSDGVLVNATLTATTGDANCTLRHALRIDGAPRPVLALSLKRGQTVHLHPPG